MGKIGEPSPTGFVDEVRMVISTRWLFEFESQMFLLKVQYSNSIHLHVEFYCQA